MNYEGHKNQAPGSLGGEIYRYIFGDTKERGGDRAKKRGSAIIERRDAKKNNALTGNDQKGAPGLIVWQWLRREGVSHRE